MLRLSAKFEGDEVLIFAQARDTAGRFAVLEDDNDGYGKLPLFEPDPTLGVNSRVSRSPLTDFI